MIALRVRRRYLHRRLDALEVRVIFRQIFEVMAHLHVKGVMHGDIKALNLLYVEDIGRWCAIDFDASAPLDDIESFAGAKFSSGNLPKEMFHELKNMEEVRAFETYFEAEKTRNSDLWTKIKPKPTGEGENRTWMVVKTFRTDKQDRPAGGTRDDTALCSCTASY